MLFIIHKISRETFFVIVSSFSSLHENTNHVLFVVRLLYSYKSIRLIGLFEINYSHINKQTTYENPFMQQQLLSSSLKTFKPSASSASNLNNTNNNNNISANQIFNNHLLEDQENVSSFQLLLFIIEKQGAFKTKSLKNVPFEFFFSIFAYYHTKKTFFSKFKTPPTIFFFVVN